MNDNAPYPPDLADDEPARLDIPSCCGTASPRSPAPGAPTLFGDGDGDGDAAAAVILDCLGTEPRSVAFLADIVRADGLAHTTELPEALPRPEAADVVRDWLQAGTELMGEIAADQFPGTGVLVAANGFAGGPVQGRVADRPAGWFCR